MIPTPSENRGNTSQLILGGSIVPIIKPTHITGKENYISLINIDAKSLTK